MGTMASFSQDRRILRVHPAHRTVGVSGVASSFRPCGLSEPLFAAEPAAEPMRILLVSGRDDGRNRAALAAFEQTVLGARNVQCERVDLAVAERKGLADADCAVVFGRGLQIVGHWSAFDADAIAGNVPVLTSAKMGLSALAPQDNDRTATNVEIAGAACWHPVLDGVGPFVSRNVASTIAHRRTNTTYLLIVRSADRVMPVAWARDGDDRAVCTLLGHAEDFGQPEFVRLLQNALEWVRR
jgi:hypothetical protein